MHDLNRTTAFCGHQTKINAVFIINANILVCIHTEALDSGMNACFRGLQSGVVPTCQIKVIKHFAFPGNELFKPNIHKDVP